MSQPLNPTLDSTNHATNQALESFPSEPDCVILQEEFKDFGNIVDVHIPKMKSDIGFVEVTNLPACTDCLPVLH